MDDVALGDEVGIEPLHHEVEVVGIGNHGGSSGNGSGIGARGSSWDRGGQLETTVDFLGLATHRVDQRTNLNSGGLAIQIVADLNLRKRCFHSGQSAGLSNWKLSGGLNLGIVRPITNSYWIKLGSRCKILRKSNSL